MRRLRLPGQSDRAAGSPARSSAPTAAWRHGDGARRQAPTAGDRRGLVPSARQARPRRWRPRARLRPVSPTTSWSSAAVTARASADWRGPARGRLAGRPRRTTARPARGLRAAKGAADPRRADAGSTEGRRGGPRASARGAACRACRADRRGRSSAPTTSRRCGWHSTACRSSTTPRWSPSRPRGRCSRRWESSGLRDARPRHHCRGGNGRTGDGAPRARPGTGSGRRWPRCRRRCAA